MGWIDIPLLIMAGYTLIGREVINQLGVETLTHCFLPVGVGGLASGIVAPLWHYERKSAIYDFG